MRVFTQVFWLEKRGNTAGEYEDAFCPSVPVMRTGEVFRCAVADGASESSFSDVWADMLVYAFCKGQVSIRLPDSLHRFQAAWARSVGSRPLPWYAEEKARKGAFSSLTGLTLRGPGSTRGETVLTPRECGDAPARGSWEAIAAGDSCVFQVRDDRLLARFPIDRSTDFSNNPFLIGSNREANTDLRFASRSGKWLAEDRFWLMTDALAQWFLAAWETGDRPWSILDTIDSQMAFQHLVSELRDRHAIRNDDSTLMSVAVT